MANTIVKTPIVYYGGKTSIVNHLLEMVPVQLEVKLAFDLNFKITSTNWVEVIFF